MPITIICVTGPGGTGKTSIIREFTRKHLGYERAKGDVLGIFEMPRLDYAIGVSGSGDALKFILRGESFLSRYDGLKVVILASRSSGETIDRVRQIATKTKAKLHFIETVKLPAQNQVDAINKNVGKIRRLLPK